MGLYSPTTALQYPELPPAPKRTKIMILKTTLDHDSVKAKLQGKVVLTVERKGYRPTGMRVGGSWSFLKDSTTRRVADTGSGTLLELKESHLPTSPSQLGRQPAGTCAFRSTCRFVGFKSNARPNPVSLQPTSVQRTMEIRAHLSAWITRGRFGFLYAMGDTKSL